MYFYVTCSRNNKYLGLPRVCLVQFPLLVSSKYLTTDNSCNIHIYHIVGEPHMDGEPGDLIFKIRQQK